ncbi:MAG: hypothetical protein QOK42_2615 [Frankiaceae bacterium]|nr:hypothetical protein [Frankiaceae bacterium]MDX6273657.1 hypothetical protein [Frankiales bacterium]
MSYREALSNREYRGLIVAQVASQWGDQLARLALALLVYQGTNSAFLASLAFATTYLPDVIGGPLLGAYADRLPRRSLMLTCDLVRAVLIGCMALPIGTAPLLVLLLVAALFTTPFAAARSALLPEVLPGPAYLSGLSLARLLDQVNQALGLVIGGVVLALLHPRGALLADSLTFLVSFVVVLATVQSRPAPRVEVAPGIRGFLQDIKEGGRIVFRQPLPRALVMLGWSCGLFCVVPEGVGVVYATEAGYGGTAAGLLVAAIPAGFTTGLLVLNKIAPGPRQFPMVLRLAIFAHVPLLLTALRPPVPVVVVLWFVSGAFQANLVPVIGAFNLAVPAAVRGRANGLAAGGLGLTQTIAIAGGGLVASALDPAAAVAWAAVGGLVVMSVLSAWWPTAELAEVAERASAPPAVPEPLPSAP